MPQPLQSLRPSPDEKLTAILDQIGRIRLRLNALALQRALFTSLALLIGGGAALVLAALAFGPLTFLASAVLLVTALVIGLRSSIKDAWRSHVDAAGTASLADRRVDFKDRLTTLVALAGRGESSLWPYLLEETLTQQQEFGVSRVERHRVSRSLYALLISGVMAALAATLVVAPAKLGLGAKASAPREVNVPVENLQVRPADPALDPGVEVSGDPKAMQELAEREQESADADSNAPGVRGGAAKLMDKARELASALQNKLTGRKAPQRPKIKLRLTDEAKNRPNSRNGHNRPGSQTARERSAENGSQRGEQQMPNSSSGASGPGTESAQGQRQAQPSPGDMASNKPIVEPAKPNPQGDNNLSNGPSEPSPGRNGPGVASHGAGTDPEHLFGRADNPPGAKDGFSITLEARLSESGPAAGGHGYVPPKVHSTLNSSQQPDEPLARGAVPADDRQTIKRVFER